MNRPARAWPRDKLFWYLTILAAIGSGLLTAHFCFGLHRNATGLIVDVHGAPLGQDFVNTWFYGRAFSDTDPGRFYDRATYARTVQQVLPNAAIASRIWSYPPPLILMAAPLGKLPYLAAYLVWCVSGLAALAFAVSRRGPPVLVACVLASPLAYAGVVTGQVSIFAAAILVSAFALLDRRPYVAGALLALLIIKPQSVLLVPVLLVASGRWKTLLAGGLAVCGIGILSIAFNGFDTWHQFVTEGIPAQAADMQLTQLGLSRFSATLTAWACQLGLSPPATMALQGSGAAIGFLLVAWVGWRGRGGRVSPEIQGVVALLGSLLATPYMLLPDLLAATALTLVLCYRDGIIQNRFVLLLVLYGPLLQALGTTLINVVPWLALIYAVWLVRMTTRSPPDPAARAAETPRTRSTPQEALSTG